MPATLDDIDSILDAGLGGSAPAPMDDLDGILDTGLGKKKKRDIAPESVVARVVEATGDQSYYERPRTEALAKYQQLGLDQAVPPSAPEAAMQTAAQEGQQAYNTTRALDAGIGLVKGLGTGATFGLSDALSAGAEAGDAWMDNRQRLDLRPETTIGKVADVGGSIVGGLIPGNFIGEAIPAIRAIANPVVRGAVEGAAGNLTYLPAQEIETGIRNQQMPSLKDMSIDALLSVGLGGALGAGAGYVGSKLGRGATEADKAALDATRNERSLNMPGVRTPSEEIVWPNQTPERPIVEPPQPQPLQEPIPNGQKVEEVPQRQEDVLRQAAAPVPETPAQADVLIQPETNPLGPGEKIPQAQAIPGAKQSSDAMGLLSLSSPKIDSAAESIGNAARAAWELPSRAKAAISNFAGKSLPRITKSSREAGEVGVEYASSRVHAQHLSRQLANEVLADVDPNKLGAVLTEDNLRSLKEGFLKEGDTRAAARVKTIIGSQGSPFKTEAEYQAALNDPAIQAAIARHQEAVAPEMDRLFKLGADIAPNEDLPTRGQQTGARINLKFIPMDETGPVGTKVTISSPSGSTQNVLPRKTPFARKATGAAESYDIDYRQIVANSIGKQLEIANQKRFYEAMVKGGDAVMFKPGETVPAAAPTLKGEPTVRYTDRKGFTLFIRKSLNTEFRGAVNTDLPLRVPLASAIAGGINKAALVGPADAVYHTANIFKTLSSSPGIGGGAIREAAATMGGVPAFLTALERVTSKAMAVAKDSPEIQEQITKLARIGALRESGQMTGFSGKLIHKLDTAARLAMDDGYTFLASKGLAADTDTARREFINQVGQYNRRLQSPLTRALRDTGLAPFVTAGKAQVSLRFRRALMGSGAEATGPGAAVALRGMVLARWTGFLASIGLANYVLTKDKGGGVLGRPGTPLLSIDTGKDDEHGKPITVNVGAVSGQQLPPGGKAGVDSLRRSESKHEATDSALSDLIASFIHPFAGPAVKLGTGAAFGSSPTRPTWKQAPVAAPGKSQAWENFKYGLGETLQYGDVYDAMKNPDASMLDKAKSIAGPFMPTVGMEASRAQSQGARIHYAKLSDYEDYIVREAKKLPMEKRMEFVRQKADEADEQDRARILNMRGEVMRRIRRPD